MRTDGTPESMRSSMCRLVGSMALTGFAGYRYVDNAGHAGGLLAGVLVGLTVRRLATSQQYESALERAGQFSIVALAVGAAFTMARLLT